MKKQTGFTLIELMVIVVVIGILLAVGIPSYRAFIADNELTSFTNDFVAAVTLARTEAIRSRANVSVIAGNDDWSVSGWNIANDTNNDNVADLNEIARSYAHKVSGTVTMTTNGIVAPDNRRVITFDSRGLMVSPSTNFTMDVCDDRTGEVGRRLAINITGRVSLNPGFICP